MKIGYARVSTKKQNIEPQIELLKEVGCEKIFSEKQSGSSADDREELQRCIEFLRSGDTFYFYKIDRIARSIIDLQKILKTLTDKGVICKSVDGSINTEHNNAMSKMMISILGTFAEFELNIRKERQEVGIEHAKEEGKYKGKTLKNKLDKNEIEQKILELLEEGKSKSFISKELNVSRCFVLNVARKAGVE